MDSITPLPKEICPYCASIGYKSELSELQFAKVCVRSCQKSICPSESLVYQVIERDHDDAPLPIHSLKKANLPLTLLREPAMKFRHVKTVMWLSWINQSDIFSWLQSEVKTLQFLTDFPQTKFKYAAPDYITKILNFSKEELQLAKHIIPELVKVVVCLKRAIELYKSSQHRAKFIH